MSEQLPTLAAAGFEMPPDADAKQLDERRRRLALEQAVTHAGNTVGINETDAASVVATAQAFYDFLNGKSAQPKE